MRSLPLTIVTLLLAGCFTNGSDHFAYPGDGVSMPDLRGRWMVFDKEGKVDSSFQVTIGDLPLVAPAWQMLGEGDSVLRTRSGLYYRDGLSFTYWSAEENTSDDPKAAVRYHPAPPMVLSFFRLGNDTFFEAHLPEGYMDRPGIAGVLRDSLGVDITTLVHIRHHIGRVMRLQRDTIDYTYGWSDGDQLIRIAQQQGLKVLFIPQGSYADLLHGSTTDLRGLLEANARVDTIRDRYRFVRIGR
jgi:hypothetical protein